MNKCAIDNLDALHRWIAIASICFGTTISIQAQTLTDTMMKKALNSTLISSGRKTYKHINETNDSLPPAINRIKSRNEKKPKGKIINDPICISNRKDELQILWRDTIPEERNYTGIRIQGTCKNFKYTYPIFPQNENPLKQEAIANAPIKGHSPLLKVTGNILYDVNYRSSIDTPYAENNVYQHTLQTRLDFLYKETYPFKIYLTTHFSNSPLFRNYTDVGFRYLQSNFARIIKAKILQMVVSSILAQTSTLDSLRRIIESNKAAIALLNKGIQNPDVSQKLVEERERNAFGKSAGGPNSVSEMNELENRLTRPGTFGNLEIFLSYLNLPSQKENNKQTDNDQKYSYADSLYEKRKTLDSLTSEVSHAEMLYNSIISAQDLNSDKWKKEIQGANDIQSLNQILKQFNIKDTSLPKGYKTLYSIQSFNIGRSIINYSELSVKDVSLTGLQLEYNPHYYYAFAAGKVDYGFQDYIVPNHYGSNQYLALARFGKGTRNGNHIILTYYTGKRQFFNSAVAVTSSNSIPSYNLAGITIEGFYKLSRNISFIAEVAKSSKPYYSLDSTQKKHWLNSATNFNDRTNEAYSAILNSYFPRTQTRVTGNIRYIGANFQSFSTFTTGASQVRWIAKIEQPFFKKKLNIVSSMQQNDYNNPFVAANYKSSSILTSLLASFHIKKWPFISVGYYPSYQLTKINNNNYSENRYYTLVANGGYYYRLHALQLSSYVVFSKFYNSAKDSGFVYFNSKNWMISQGASIQRFSSQLNLSLSTNEGYSIYTIESFDQMNISRLLTLGAGVKINKQTLLSQLQCGYSGSLIIRIPKLGDIQFMADKGFIPGYNRRLVENNVSRLTYFKTF